MLKDMLISSQLAEGYHHQPKWGCIESEKNGRIAGASWVKHQLIGGLEYCLFSMIYAIILPIVFYIFQDGYCTTNQPGTCFISVLHCFFPGTHLRIGRSTSTTWSQGFRPMKNLAWSEKELLNLGDDGHGQDLVGSRDHRKSAWNVASVEPCPRLAWFYFHIFAAKRIHLYWFNQCLIA